MYNNQITVIGSTDCPHCHQSGLFYYTKAEGFEIDFYRCEECLSKFDNDMVLLPAGTRVTKGKK